MKVSNLDLQLLQNALTLVRPVATEVAPEVLRDVEALWKEKTGDQKATIMLYGMYSHGKSTILNALLGKNAAEIGRAPTTDDVDEYEWAGGNCLLLDTPGIQAKYEDTKKTDARLSQCELVAFVVQSGCVEERQIWEDLARMVKQGQKVCLIINDFDRFIDDQEKIERVKDLFRRNLQQSAGNQNYQGDIVKSVPLLVVDANLALKGRLENKPLLVERSGLLEVEKELMHMAASLNRDDIITSLRRAILGLICSCNSRLSLDSGSADLAEAEDRLSSIKAMRDQTLGLIQQELEERIAFLAPTIRQIYETGADGSAMASQLSPLAAGLVQEMSGVVQQEMSKASRDIQELTKQFDSFEMKICPAQMENSEGKPFVPFDQTAIGTSLKAMSSVLLKGQDLEALVQTGVTTVLGQLKDWFPSFFVGKGAATFGRWASTAAAALGPIVAIGGIIYDLYNAHRAEQEAIDRARRRAQAIADAVTMTQKGLKDAFMARINEFFGESFDALIAELQKRISAMRQKSAANKDQREALAKAESMLAA